MSGAEILVVGSINLDMLVFQGRLPLRGETAFADEFREDFGGKGANQAVQCARLGNDVIFVGAVGADPRGASCVKNLQDHGIECYIRSVDAPTGLGFVHVVGAGDVYATVLRGANDWVDGEWVHRHEHLFARAGIVLLQNEVPVDGVEAAIRLAADRGARVLLNAAPAREIDPGLTRLCDYLIVNEEEAMFFLGRRVRDLQEMRYAIPELKEYCSRVIVTLGESGSLVSFDSEIHHVPAITVEPVDTTGAGDSFVGALAVGLNEGLDDLVAASMAAAVAAVTTAGAGAQTRMPRREEVRHEAVRAKAPDYGPPPER
ncbi:MAG TPA: ribokinase [Coriobacteriia bacterium]|nr:ribokinase [Coriobacteriia bacterium]